MPNLVPPVRTTEDAAAYRAQILAAVPEGVAFDPMMTLYLTDNTTPEEIATAAASGFVRGCKLYPAGLYKFNPVYPQLETAWFC
jgi:dihydroorotase